MKKIIVSLLFTLLSTIARADYVTFDGVHSNGELDQLYTIESVGDYFEFKIKFLNTSAHYTKNLGVFGTKLNNQSHVVGLLTSSSFGICANTSSWVSWYLPELDRSTWNTFKVEVTSVGKISLKLNGVIKGEKEISLPLKLQDIANAYSGQLAHFAMKDMVINTATQHLSVLSLNQNSSTTLANAIVKKEMHPISCCVVRLNIHSNNDNLSIRVPASKEGYFIEYNLRHHTNADRNADIWHLQSTYVTDSEFSRGIQITNNGEVETPIKQSVGGVDKSDFMGGLTMVMKN